jgi:hypothetical protein
MQKLTPREARLKRLYGLQPGEYEKILLYQCGVCFICKRPPKEGTNLHVDHNHKTGETRGLLCWQCNGALGKFKDDSLRLINAAKYVENPPASLACEREIFGRSGRITNKRKRKRKKTVKKVRK